MAEYPAMGLYCWLACDSPLTSTDHKFDALFVLVSSFNPLSITKGLQCAETLESLSASSSRAAG
jgi:hypothetical protein